jgi:2-C-methyl-D-erythritol 4-phosphate cytidylyltransferase/2-C-methyl-D-erythritol 2,4-cyclodiphosphate synthase
MPDPTNALLFAGPVVGVIVAAGRGVRAGGEIPKQFCLLAGTPVLTRTLALFLDHPQVDHVVAVIAEPDRDLYRMATSAIGSHPKLRPAAIGGETRQASVRAGLEASVPLEPGAVLVHDGVRPLAGARLVSATLAALAGDAGAIPALPVSDTLKRGAGGRISGTVDRAGLYGAQTPQAFRFADLLAAHRRAAAERRHDFTDDAALLEWQGQTVALVAGDPDNVKITAPDDFARAERILGSMAEAEFRTGIGYDVHAFGDGTKVMLGGVEVAHTHGIVAHSDGDLVLHAATDAVLGAIADGDIGAHFPPSDPAWRGASSDRFLAFAAERVRRLAGTIAHLDITVVAEAPPIGPYREAMRRAIAAAAGVEPARVSVKATSSERLGFTGRREGLAALAIATVRLPAASKMSR